MTTDRLLQNYPNPFSGSTEIRYQIPDNRCQTQDARHITLAVHDLSGRLLKTLVDGSQSVTSYESPVAVRWDGRNGSGRAVANGVYFYRLSVVREGGEFVSTRKMMVVR